VRAEAFSLAKQRIKAEQEALLPTLRTTFHPLALRHEFHSLVHFENKDNLWFFFHLNYFLVTFLREENP
jgi:hypothetical protein